MAIERHMPSGTMRPLLHAWVSWVTGPACFAYCVAVNDGEPDCWLGLLAVVGHGAALLLTLAMAGSPARFRRLPEFWFMVTYWIPIAILFFSLVIDVNHRVPGGGDGLGEAARAANLATNFRIGRICMLTSLGWVGLIPMAGVVRLILAAWRAACDMARAR